MSISMILRQEPQLSQRQVLEQHLSRELSQRLALIEELHGDAYRPEAQCPACHHVLKPLAIIRGFNADPNDFNTTCPKCEFRFPPKLALRNRSGRTDVAFYCAAQTGAKLQASGLEFLEPAELRRREAALYHSAIFHFGTLTQAFSLVGIEYRLEVIEDKLAKVELFLGTLPDTVIARTAGVKLKTVRKLRRDRAIAPYHR